MYKHAIYWPSGLDIPRESEYEKRIKKIYEAFERKKPIVGKVARIENYGVIVSLGSKITGLLHISEISKKWVDNPGKYFKEGQRIDVNVISIGLDKKRKIYYRISLSTKQFEKYGPSGNRRKIYGGTRRRVMTSKKNFTIQDLVDKFNKNR